MDDAFDSAWLKWAMAVVNAEVLQRNLNAIAGQGKLQMRFGLMQEYDAKCHCIVVTAAEVPGVFPPICGLLLGDLVHDYRSSLDHLAWALYKRGRTPNLSKSQEQGVYFPIACSREQFNGWLKGKRPKLPGVRRADIAIVRRYQPYKRGQTNLYRHVLKVLDDLSNADKHRVIQPIQAVPEQAGYRVTNERYCVVTRISPRARRTPLKPGAELARFYVRKTRRGGPDPEIDVEPHFTIDPAITERLTFQEWGYQTMRFTAAILSEFAKPPKSVFTLLAGTTHGPAPDWLSPSKG